MKTKYETLDAYLDDLDAVKEKIAKRLHGKTTEQVLAYFAGAERRLRKKVAGRKASPRRKIATAKR